MYYFVCDLGNRMNLLILRRPRFSGKIAYKTLLTLRTVFECRGVDEETAAGTTSQVRRRYTRRAARPGNSGKRRVWINACIPTRDSAWVAQQADEDHHWTLHRVQSSSSASSPGLGHSGPCIRFASGHPARKLMSSGRGTSIRDLRGRLRAPFGPTADVA